MHLFTCKNYSKIYNYSQPNSAQEHSHFQLNSNMDVDCNLLVAIWTLAQTFQLSVFPVIVSPKLLSR